MVVVVVVVVEQFGFAVLAIVSFEQLVRMCGEELGWRGYLLPALTEEWGRTGATAAVGVVWALFHSVFLYRAAAVTGVGDPLVVTAVQAVAVFTISFSFAYCFFLSNGSVLPVAIFHLVWNILNPWILGNVYPNVQGVVAGNILLVTGEGVLGAAVGLVLIAAFVVLFRREVLIQS